MKKQSAKLELKKDGTTEVQIADISRRT